MKTLCLTLTLAAMLGTVPVAQAQSPLGDANTSGVNSGHNAKDSIELFARATQLQQQGEWRQAMPLLEQVIVSQPDNAAALYQLGSMKSWEPSQRKPALDLLRRACESGRSDTEYCSAYAEVLSWRTEDRTSAVVVLQKLLDAHPENTPARLRLAQILSWENSSRADALAIYERGLERDPENLELLIASAEVLAWSDSTRAQAMDRYKAVLQQNPDEPRALTGKAQLLAWEGKSDEAMQLYNRVLAKDSHNPAALRGKAEILNWRGHYSEARPLAEAAAASDAGDNGARLELARADIGLHKYAAARDAIATLNGDPGPGLDETRQEIHRGLGTWMEFGFDDRREHALAYDRFAVSLSSLLAPGHRFTFEYQPTLFDAGVSGFNTNYFTAALDSEPSDKFTSHFQFGAETFNNAPVTYDGGMDLRFKPVSSVELKAAFLRQPVEESLLSRRGLDLAPFSTFQGQIQSNLGTLGLSYYNSAHKYDLSVDYTDGIYTGENLSNNRRYSIDAQIGRALRGDRPYIRLAYGVNYTSFDHDVDIQNSVIVPGFTGGYFSPTRFLLNQAVLSTSHKFNSKLRFDATGTAGVQNVETSTASFSNSQFASSFGTHLFWRFSAGNELTFGYDYLNVFNAFHRHLYGFKWRVYF